MVAAADGAKGSAKDQMVASVPCDMIGGQKHLTKLHAELVEEGAEVPQATIQESIEEVPIEVQYVEKIAHVPQVVYVERIVEVPTVEAPGATRQDDA